MSVLVERLNFVKVVQECLGCKDSVAKLIIEFNHSEHERLKFDLDQIMNERINRSLTYIFLRKTSEYEIYTIIDGRGISLFIHQNFMLNNLVTSVEYFPSLPDSFVGKGFNNTRKKYVEM